MRGKLFITMMLLCHLPVYPVYADILGHVAFFYGNSDQSCDTYGDASADLIYAYDRLVPWFENRRFTHSRHSTTDFMITLPNDKTLRFDATRLMLKIGVVLIKRNGEFKEVLPGTDLDIRDEIEAYFNLE